MRDEGLSMVADFLRGSGASCIKRLRFVSYTKNARK